MEKQRKIIIAMKGHPGTGKTTLAKAVATALHCPLLDKDDIRDATFSFSSTVPSTLLNQFSYDALWRVASTQLKLGLSIVVDSPLSRRAHFDMLLSMARETGHKVVIVECRPTDCDTWRRRVEERGGEGGGGENGWHKPKTWRDMERLLEGYDGCTEYDVGDVEKLVVDTTGPDGLQGSLGSVLGCIDAHCCAVGSQ